MNKRYLRPGLIAVATLVPMGLALAAPVLPTPTPAPPAVSAFDRSKHLNTLKTHGAAEVDRRLAMFQTVSTRLASSTQLTAVDKTTLGKLVEDQVTTLGALKSKLAAENDLTAARKDVQAIIDEYRVYGLLVAQISLVTASDRMAETNTQLMTVVTELQKKADVLKKAGKETTDVQKDIDAAKTAITAAQPLFVKLSTQMIAFKAPDYPAGHISLVASRDDITKARDGFRTARVSIDSALDAIDKLK